MGILNITPDSFSDGGNYATTSKAIAHAKHMIATGADIIDIGGESTRPGAEPISVKEELKRVIPVIKKLKTAFPKITLSIDTWKSDVAQEAIKQGCTLVNSLGGFLFDEQLAKIVATYQVKIMSYHIKGTPKTMQQGEITYTNILADINAFFEQQLSLGKQYGIKKNQFILDPGVGFGKTVEQNLSIIKNLHELTHFGLPLAIGVSRKSHLGTILQEDLGITTEPIQRLEAGLAETAIAVQNGADIIRTHDVLATKKFLAVLNRLS